MMIENTFPPDSAATPPDSTEAVREHYEHDKQVFQTLLLEHPTLKRTVEKLPDGLISVYLSENKKIVQLLQQHAPATFRRINDENCTAKLSQLYSNIEAHVSNIETRIENITLGVVVTETTKDSATNTLLHELSEAIDQYIQSCAKKAG